MERDLLEIQYLDNITVKMKILISPIFSVEIEKKTVLAISISNNLENYFNDKDYGEDLKEIIISIICVSEGFEQFFKPKKPKYIKDKKIIISNLTKQTHEIEKSLEYDIKLDFQEFKNATEKESKKIIAREILLSLDTLEPMKKKIKDFEWETFKRDLEIYFVEKK